MKETFDDEKKKEIEENKEKYKTFLADLKLSLQQKKITQDQYDKMAAEAEEIFNKRELAIDNTIFAVMNYAQYSPTAIVLNPITVNQIMAEKDTTGRSLELVQNS